jgi:hypothetical protein
MHFKRTFGKPYLVLIALPALLMLACGGDSGTRFDPQRAAELTQAALITPNDLPGAGWRVIDSQASDEANLDLVAEGACSDVKSVLDDSKIGAAGHAERALERPTYVTRFGVIVTVEITAYDDSRSPAKLMRRYRKLASDGSLAGCLAKLSERTLSLRPLKASSATPHSGVAFAAIRQFTALSGPPLTRVDERYLWLDGNVAVLVLISAPRDHFTSDVVRAALEKTDAAVTQAGKAR